MGRNQWVSSNPGGGWDQKAEGADRATRHFDTQAEAIAAARETAINQASELIIQGTDGRIRERNSYGNDPHPPKG